MQPIFNAYREKGVLLLQKAKRILIVTLILLLVLTGVVGATGWHYWGILENAVNRPSQTKIDAGEMDASYTDPKLLDPEDIGIVVQPKKETQDDIYNILLFGIDVASGEKGRSDVICYASVNKSKGTIALISVLRDTLVEIPGHGQNKVNAAFSFGGPQLALATLNSTFHTDVTDYAVVNFNDMEALIDAMGGVEIDVEKSEVSFINRGVREVNRKNGRSQSDGSLASDNYGPKTLLTGRQAVAYARIRKLSGGDYQRSNRQRIVLDALITKGLSEVKQDPMKLVPMVANLLPMVTTSIANDDIIDIVQALLGADSNEIIQDRIPANGEFDQGYHGDQWVEFADFDKAIERLHAYLYKEETALESLQPTGTPAPEEVVEGEALDPDDDLLTSDGTNNAN